MVEKKRLTSTSTRTHTKKKQLPIAVTVFATVWFLNFFDHLFAPVLEALLGFRIVGLGFATSMLFIFATGVVASSYIGGALISFGEWIIRRLPLVKHVFSAAKQISAAITPGVEGGGGENGVGGSFRECVLVKNPRLGNFMLVSLFYFSFFFRDPFFSPRFFSFPLERERRRGRGRNSTSRTSRNAHPSKTLLVQAFVTGATRLRGAPPGCPSDGSEGRDLDLVAVYAATNHFVFGDVFLVPRSVRRSLFFLPLSLSSFSESGRDAERKKEGSRKIAHL